MKPKSFVDSSIIDQVVANLHERFDVKINPPPILWDNKQLGFLAGACYIGSGQYARILLNPVFKKQEKWFCYSRDEVIAHELVHHQRRALDSIKYEEIIAYQTSDRRFRRYWGGIFRCPREPLVLVVLSILFFVVTVFEALNQSGFLIRSCSLVIFFAYTSYLILRHWLCMQAFLKVAKSLRSKDLNPMERLIHWDDAAIDQAAQKNAAQKTTVSSH